MLRLRFFWLLELVHLVLLVEKPCEGGCRDHRQDFCVDAVDWVVCEICVDDESEDDAYGEYDEAGDGESEILARDGELLAARRDF